MVDIDEVESLLPDRITVLEKIDETFKLKLGNFELLLPESECEMYLKQKEHIYNTQTSIFSPGYYEQYIENLGHFGLMPLFRGEQREICIEGPDGAKACVSSLSYLFILANLKDESFYRFICRYFPALRRMDAYGNRQLFLSNLADRILSIKVILPDTHKFYSNREQLTRLAKAGLFHISYNSGIALNLANTWEKSNYRLGKIRSRDYQFPSRLYNSDLLAYYQLALSSESLMLSYIGLYKILEHFFVTSTEKVLHKRVADLLVTPDFSHKKANKLRQLILLIRKFDQKTNEMQMLVTVLEEHFEIDQIVDWVTDYEKENGTYYTAPKSFLGETYNLDTNADQIYSSLAKRIYSVRNALVHSKEAEMPRYVPFSGQEEFIAKELPILAFLAESLIINTGIDL